MPARLDGMSSVGCPSKRCLRKISKRRASEAPNFSPTLCECR
jgi:hypothetical protein